MLRGLGATVTRSARRSSPRPARTPAGHHAHSGEAKHAGIIHDFAARAAVPLIARCRTAPPAPDGAACALLPLVRLLQLASPALPIGAYSYSQGLERAVEAGHRARCATAQAWIGDVLEWRRRAAARRRSRGGCSARRSARDWRALATWNAWFRASRETAELRAETEQMGGSLAKLAADLDLLDAPARGVASRARAGHAAGGVRARGARLRACRVDAALAAYVWSWLENQVLAAMKLVPLGQVAGQRLLAALGAQDSAGRRHRDDARRRRPVDVRARARARERAPRNAVHAAVSFVSPAGTAMQHDTSPNHCASASAARSAPARPR